LLEDYNYILFENFFNEDNMISKYVKLNPNLFYISLDITSPAYF